MHLSTVVGLAEFDALHDNLPAWRAAIESLAAEHSAQTPVVQMASGTVLVALPVALLGSAQALKLYPPFLRDHFEFEHAMLQRVGGQLMVPTPVLLSAGEREGWPSSVQQPARAECTPALAASAQL